MPLGGRQVLWLLTLEGTAMHRLCPAEMHLEAALCELPESFFRSFVAGWFAVEKQRDLAFGELLRPARDLLDLLLCDAV